MSTLLYLGGDETGTPADPLIVRATTEKVFNDSPPAEQDAPPDQNEIETDGNPNLGMVNRQLASEWHEPIKGRNAVSAQASAQLAEQVNRQVASAGRAPNLEETNDVFGHGSVAWAYGIEPTLADGHAFGSDYFAANPTGSQEGIPQVMSVAPGYDRSVTGDVAQSAKERTRDATQSSQMYAKYYAAVIG